jgi:hypothetical protein
MGKLSGWLSAFPVVYPFIELVPRTADSQIVVPEFRFYAHLAYLDWRKPGWPSHAFLLHSWVGIGVGIYKNYEAPTPSWCWISSNFPRE